ncbi:hypothetical protein ABZW10_36450 [Kitasatospora sp. NPDC004723]|uniref:hypothetical protein n=1 Tax=Kitasatospora sp. NPDC004723 TaxID=3154288 RepID=UPI0033AC005D
MKYFGVLDGLLLIAAIYLGVRTWQHGETWQNAGIHGLVVYGLGYGALRYLTFTKTGTTKTKGRAK